MIRILSWNMGGRRKCWAKLAESAFHHDSDVALLQEVRRPVGSLRAPTDFSPSSSEEWTTAGLAGKDGYRTTVCRLSERVELMQRPTGHLGIEVEKPDFFPVSRPGTVAMADVRVKLTQEVLTLVSVYGFWERPPDRTDSRWLMADASVHRLISDLALFQGRPEADRLIVAGDLNILYGYGEHRKKLWKRRYELVFARLETIGLALVGPQAPNGRQADPWPEELPRDSRNVPTFHHSGQTPATATRQLDYVFVSQAIAERVQVRALNGIEEWGPSDHCPVLIEVRDD
jgi:exonuclease III